MKNYLKIIFLLVFVVLCNNIFSQIDSSKNYSTIYITRTEENGPELIATILIGNQSPINLSSKEVIVFKIYSEGEIPLSAQYDKSKEKLSCNLNVKKGNDYYVFLRFDAFKEVEVADIKRFKTFIDKKQKTELKRSEDQNIKAPVDTVPPVVEENNGFPYAIINFVRPRSAFYSGACFITFQNQQVFGLPVGVVKYKVYSEGEISIAADYQGMQTIYCTINVKKGKEYYINLRKDHVKANASFKIVPYEEVQKDIAKAEAIINKEENIDFPINKASLESSKKEGQATCFLISSEGYFVTNFHCIENSKEIYVKGIDGDFSTKYGATLIASDPSNDLALLKITNKNVKFNSPVFGFRSSGVSQAEKIYALGYPKATSMGQEMKITDGIISSKSGVHGDISKFQISAAVNPGNSGGPLIDENGNVVGVIYAKSTIAESAGYAIKASYLEAFLKNVDGFSYPIFNNTLKDKTLTEKVSKIKAFIFILETN